jgi:tetratricopeptide (TPR) repeat protein
MPVGVNKNDVLHVLGCCAVEQSRTLVAAPVRRDEGRWGLPDPWGPVVGRSPPAAAVEANISTFPPMWSTFAAAHRNTPIYREWLGAVHQFRGQVRAQLGRAADAKADLEKSQDVFQALVNDFPHIPSYRGDLGRTYVELGRLTRAAGDRPVAAAWFAKAINELGKAVAFAPDREQDRRSLAQARAELE